MESMIAWVILDAAGALHFGGAMIAARGETRRVGIVSQKASFSFFRANARPSGKRTAGSGRARRSFSAAEPTKLESSEDFQDAGGGTRVTRRGGASRAASTARARAPPRKGRRDARARGGGPNLATARPRGGARARRRHSRCLLRRRAATGVPRFRKRARSRSRGAVPSQRAVQVDANVADETFARPKPRVPTRNAPPRRRARRVLEPATRLAAGRRC